MAPSALPVNAALPAAARRVPAYEALAADIKRRGIDAVFGLMSDDTALFVTSLDSMGVRFYGARHETVGNCIKPFFESSSSVSGISDAPKSTVLASICLMPAPEPTD